MSDIMEARIELEGVVRDVPGCGPVYANARTSILEIRVAKTVTKDVADGLPKVWRGFETMVTVMEDPIRHSGQRDYRGNWNR